MAEVTGQAAPLLRRASLRAVLGAAAPGVGGLVIAATLNEADAATLVSHNEIGGQPTYYHNLETDGITRQAFSFDPTFYSRVETWFAFWRLNTPDHWTAPHRICLNGVYVNKAGAHGQGWAMDMGRHACAIPLVGGLVRGFDGRHKIGRASCRERV